MPYEVVEGVKYYWISYKNIEDALSFLGLGKIYLYTKLKKAFLE